MQASIRLTVLQEDGALSSYRFDDTQECYVGRSFDCDIQLPVIEGKQDISPHHCLFRLAPPFTWVMVLARSNPTFVNDLLVTSTPDDPYIELRDGDEVQVGDYVIAVNVETDNFDESVMAGPAITDSYKD